MTGRLISPDGLRKGYVRTVTQADSLANLCVNSLEVPCTSSFFAQFGLATFEGATLESHRPFLMCRQGLARAEFEADRVRLVNDEPETVLKFINYVLWNNSKNSVADRLSLWDIEESRKYIEKCITLGAPQLLGEVLEDLVAHSNVGKLHPHVVKVCRLWVEEFNHQEGLTKQYLFLTFVSLNIIVETLVATVAVQTGPVRPKAGSEEHFYEEKPVVFGHRIIFMDPIIEENIPIMESMVDSSVFVVSQQDVACITSEAFQKSALAERGLFAVHESLPEVRSLFTQRLRFTDEHNAAAKCPPGLSKTVLCYGLNLERRIVKFKGYDNHKSRHLFLLGCSVAASPGNESPVRNMTLFTAPTKLLDGAYPRKQNKRIEMFGEKLPDLPETILHQASGWLDGVPASRGEPGELAHVAGRASQIVMLRTAPSVAINTIFAEFPSYVSVVENASSIGLASKYAARIQEYAGTCDVNKESTMVVDVVSRCSKIDGVVSRGHIICVAVYLLHLVQSDLASIDSQGVMILRRHGITYPSRIYEPKVLKPASKAKKAKKPPSTANAAVRAAKPSPPSEEGVGGAGAPAKQQTTQTGSVDMGEALPPTKSKTKKAKNAKSKVNRMRSHDQKIARSFRQDANLQVANVDHRRPLPTDPMAGL